MRVSAGLPTGMEGLTYPIPFSDPENVIRIAQAAEKFGYDSVWGNDHMTTQNYVRAEFPVPPRFWEPLVTYAFVLSETKTHQGRHRHPGAADAPRHRGDRQADRHARSFRQGPAGDRRRHRRLSRGVQGAAARRQDGSRRHRRRGPAGAATCCSRSASRASTASTTSSATSSSTPSPCRSTSRSMSAATTPTTSRRTVKWADGWLPAGMHVDRVRAGVKTLREMAEKAGRDPKTIEVCPQFVVHVGKTHQAAVESFRKSQMNKHLVSLSKSTLKGQGTATPRGHQPDRHAGRDRRQGQRLPRGRRHPPARPLFRRQLGAGADRPDADLRRRGDAEDQMTAAREADQAGWNNALTNSPL